MNIYFSIKSRRLLVVLVVWLRHRVEWRQFFYRLEQFCLFVLGCWKVISFLPKFLFILSSDHTFLYDFHRYSLAFYQLIFANTASTIVSGAVAERLNLPCYFIYGFLLTGIDFLTYSTPLSIPFNNVNTITLHTLRFLISFRQSMVSKKNYNFIAFFYHQEFN